MSLTEIDGLAALLRCLTYVAAVCVGGGILYYATVRGARMTERAVLHQVWFGIGLLFLVEPLRYLQFQLAITSGDFALAFDPSMRWMAFETPIGQAALVRFGAASIILLSGLRYWPVSVLAALAMVGSFTLEGHTAGMEGERWLAGGFLFAHLTIVHWWLGSLYPLRAAVMRHDNDAYVVSHAEVASVVTRFGQLALAAIGILVVAGSLLVVILTEWTLDLSQPYQRLFLAKLAVFMAILAVAAINKLRWTPALRSDPRRGRVGLRKSLNFEIGLCLAILCTTALLTSVAPSG